MPRSDHYNNYDTKRQIMESIITNTGILEDAKSIATEMIDLRRTIHSNPELGLHLPETQQLILKYLENLGFDITLGKNSSSIIAILKGDQPGPSTLLRADMDALPMPEDTGLGYASKIPNRMHACGHDAHVAMLCGAAKILALRKSELRGRAVLMFQPGEEGYGGAAVMIEEGLINDFGTIDRAFAIHITPVIPRGIIAIKSGTLMASADEFSIEVIGKGGHASMPSDAVDPIPVMCEIVLALQSMVTRRIPAFDPAVLTVSKIEAGTTSNVIPEKATALGTLRAVSENTRLSAIELIERVVINIAKAHGCEALLQLHHGSYPVTINNEVETQRTAGITRELLGQNSLVMMPTPVMGAEDWSFVLQNLPGAMAFLGAAPPGVAMPAPNHSNKMIIDEDAMAIGAALYAAMAL